MASIERRALVASAARLPWPDDVHPVLRQVLSRRPVDSLDDLDLELGRLTPVGHFSSLEDAVALLLAHRERRIVIVGDYDSDGATSAALMLLVLEELRFSDVSTFIPDRFDLGYGLTPGVIDRIAGRDPTLVVTVDNGISSVAGVAAARAAGIDVLITDHHLPPRALPEANVLVNPNLPGDDFSGKSLAGVGVVFYLMAALARRLGQARVAARYLDLVALGTVADLVTLDRLNRILVEQGVRRIRAGRCRPGITALCEVAGIECADVTTAALGFKLAPRLNAAGRLDDMSIGLRCLTTPSRREARSLAARLDELNTERRALETKMRAEALRIVDESAEESATERTRVVCVFREDWHEGLVGLIASRVKEQCYRPAFAFAPAGDGSLKGSGRSIAGFHLRDALTLADAENPGLIERFGGHAMAAGLTLKRELLDTFSAVMDDIGGRQLTPEQLEHKVLTDGSIEPSFMTLEVAQMLRDAAPWGQGFPEPLFDGVFEVLEHTWLKGVHLKMSLRPIASAAAVDAIAFNCTFGAIDQGTKLRIAYRLSVNDFRATRRLQLVVEHIEPDAGAN
jgi:single-stranded-DNA-specific exonuclease